MAIPTHAGSGVAQAFEGLAGRLTTQVLEVGLANAGAETLGVPITEVLVEGSAGALGQHGAASSTRGGVAALAAHGVGNHAPASPRFQQGAVHEDVTGLGDVADAHARIPGALPAGVDIPEGIDDVHGVVGAAERGGDASAPGLLVEYLPGPELERVVGAGDAGHGRVLLAELLEGLAELPGVEDGLGARLVVAGVDGGGVGPEVVTAGPTPGLELLGHLGELGDVVAVDVHAHAHEHAAIERQGDVPGDALERAGAILVDAPAVMLPGRTIDGHLEAGNTVLGEQVLVGIQLGGVGDGVDGDIATGTHLLDEVLDDGPAAGQEGLAAEEDEPAGDGRTFLDAVRRLDVAHSLEDAVRHG